MSWKAPRGVEKDDPLGSDLEAHHVQRGRELGVEVQSEVAECRQAEQRHFDGVEQLDDGDGDRVVEHAAQADAQNITVAPSSRALRTPIFFMMIRTTPIIIADSKEEDLETVQGAVGGVADFFSGEEVGVVGQGTSADRTQV